LKPSRPSTALCRRYLIAIVMLIAFGSTNSLHATELRRYVWPAVPEATHYIVTTKLDDGRVVRVMTEINELTLESTATVESIEALSHDPKDLSAAPTGMPARRRPGSGEPETKWKSLGRVTAEPASLRQIPTVQAPPPAAQPAPPQDAEARTNELLGEEPARQTGLPWLKAIDIRIGPGMGIEKVTAEGGASEFTGESRLSSASLDAIVNTSVGDNPAWYTGIHISTHEFAPEITEQTDGEATAAKKRTLKSTRLKSAIVGWSNSTPAWLAKGSSNTEPSRGRMLLGVGGALIRQPALQVSDKDSSAALPEDLTGFGPLLAARIERAVASAHELGLGLDLVPHLFGSMITGNSVSASAWWQLKFTENVYSSLAVGSRRDSARLKAGCPVGNVCKETSAATAVSTQMQLGLGLRF